MATAKLTWIFIQLFGWPMTFISLGGKIAELLNLPPQSFILHEPYQSVVSVLSIVFLITMILRSFESWRKMHIDNNERSYSLKKEHEKKR